jgi:hypothetical protein
MVSRNSRLTLALVRALRRRWRADRRIRAFAGCAFVLAVVLIAVASHFSSHNGQVKTSPVKILKVVSTGHKSMLTIAWKGNGYLDLWNIVQMHGSFRASRQNPNGVTVHSWGPTLIVRFPKNVPPDDYELKVLSGRQSGYAILQVKSGGFNVWE